MLLADVVTTSAAVAATRSRLAKVEAIASLLQRVPADEIVAATGYLVGDPPQGRVGIGWATVRDAGDGRASTASLTVADVALAIDGVRDATGSGSVRARREILTSLFARATPPEADFLRRLLLGELRQGALEGVMADAIARAAAVPGPVVRRAAMLSGDLRTTALLAVTGGRDALEDIRLDVMRPILPMLAATSEDVAQALAATGAASVEWKLDGARIQVHRRDDDVRVYTRNLNDVTDRLPAVVDAVRRFPAHTLGLDGEAIGVADDERPERFQDTMSRFGRQNVDEHGIPLTAFFFDCLRIDDDDLLDAPLATRLDVLAPLAGPRTIPSLRTDDPTAAEACLEESLAAGHEGVMVKSLTSPYEAGRRGGAWRKVKPVKTLDLVVLAVEWGSGRRRGWLSNLHLGARGPDNTFVMVGKTFKGLTDALLAWQTDRFLDLKLSEEDHVVFVRPEQVVEIALDGVQASRRYPGGVALRFARVRRYRDDKSPAEADTIETVQSLLG
jgi:DNA ligase-1